MALFENRREAGRRLITKLPDYAQKKDVVVLALPRGGVPVAYEVANGLQAALEIFLVRKIGAPGQEELAMGAIASGGIQILNQEVIDGLGIPASIIESTIAREQQELQRRTQLYRAGQRTLEVAGKTVILVDDGLATGASMRAAVAAIRQKKPGRIVVAVPVAASETLKILQREVDEVICLAAPYPFYGVGYWYEDFSQTSDEEVIHLLEQSSKGISPENEQAYEE